MVLVEVWWSSLVAADRDLLAVLDATERSRVEALERPADQGRSMVAAAVLRVAVGERLGVPPPEVRIDRTCAECGRPHGRPRVLGPGGPLPEVSVSHSGLLVVVAVSDRAAVGVDVQRVADLGEPVESWVRREAVLKVGADPSGREPAVRSVPTPLDGYVAALATLTDAAPTDAELLVRHWPAPGTGAATSQ